MKKKLISLLLIGIILLPTIFPKAETLKDYKKLLNKYKSEQAANKDKINKNQNEITSSNSEIESIKKEIQDISQEVENMKKQIVDYNNEIKAKEIESKEVVAYYQLSKSQNLYLEYAFGAETITDLVYRMSVVDQIVSKNTKTIDNLNAMIKANQDREVELNQKEKDIREKQNQLTSRITELTGINASLNETSVSIAGQIKIYEDLVGGYEKQGCKDDDVIGRDCAVNSNMSGWYRPIESGYVTSEFGYRWGSLHRAVDMSNKNPYNTKIYPVANGVIKAKYLDYYGALTVVIQHKDASGQYYSSLYTHMSKYAPNIYVGKKVTPNDYIGYMGKTGIGTGPHLHLEIAPCRLYDQADKNCGSWDKYVNYVKNLYNNGRSNYKGPRSYLYFPSPYVTFNGRS